MHLKIPKISHDETVSAFIKGLRFHETLWSKLLHKRPSTVAKLLAIAKNYANTDDAEKLIRQRLQMKSTERLASPTRRQSRPPRAV